MNTSSSKIIALLGPTNTGKTYVAIEKMLEFETGIFGLLFLLISICIISIKSFNLYKKTNELHFLAAFSSLIGLVLLVNFSNFINTFMFAIIVGLSLAIQNFKKTDE